MSQLSLQPPSLHLTWQPARPMWIPSSAPVPSLSDRALGVSISHLFAWREAVCNFTSNSKPCLFPLSPFCSILHALQSVSHAVKTNCKSDANEAVTQGQCPYIMNSQECCILHVYCSDKQSLISCCHVSLRCTVMSSWMTCPWHCTHCWPGPQPSSCNREEELSQQCPLLYRMEVEEWIITYCNQP